ncbi:MAG: hypothetical protein JW839_16090 [Candidatus Lokiarchaeota archaeon]|nr:hypothetical protein [Candidatus Lokiarchaeota archaeon]
MLDEESRNKYLTLLIGITIGAILGFIFGMFVSGVNTTPSTGNPSQMFGVPRIEPVTTTIVGCIASIGVVLLYLYITEWSKRASVPKEKTTARGAE